MGLRRRDLLITTTFVFAGAAASHAAVIAGSLPWHPNAGSPPEPVQLGPWLFFTGPEAAAIEALADRVIPPDPETPGGKDAGCAVFIDRQLAGPYGRQEGLYTRPPFLHGLKEQGLQSEAGPARRYREGLAALDRYCRSEHGGKAFAELPETQQDDILTGLEKGSIHLASTDGKEFFAMVAKDVKQGFFADPIYGGNRDMVGWRMIGFPGARYDYRDWVNRHNERFPLPPVSIAGRADWTPKTH
jgi:gluconate 2-dehydrogenase gamma chain